MATVKSWATKMGGHSSLELVKEVLITGTHEKDEHLRRNGDGRRQIVRH